MTKVSNNLFLMKVLVPALTVLVIGCASNPKPSLLNDNKELSSAEHSDFIAAYSLAFKETFYVLGDTTADLSKFKSATFYVATSDKIDELEDIFHDYATRIGTNHVAFFLKYGTEDYIKRLDEMRCFHIASFRFQP